MRFSTSKEKILNAVLIAERIVGKKESLPVLSCVLFDGSGSVFSVRATNLEAGVTLQVPGDVGEGGIIAVPAHIVSQTIRSLGGDMVTLRSEGENLVIESRGTKTLIKAVPHTEFPNLPVPDTSKDLMVVSREALLGALSSVSYAASPSMIRPELGSIFLSVNSGVLSAVATDSFRLAEKTITGASSSGEGGALIPLKHALEVSHVLERLSDDRVSLVVDDSQIALIADNLTFVSRVVDGTFPNYKEVVPTSFSTEATALKSDVVEVLRKARIFAGTEQRAGLHVYPGKKVFDVTAQSPNIGEMSDSIEAALSGDDVDINFHIGYLSDCFGSIQSDSVTLGFSGAGKPLVIRGTSDKSFMYLVMPLNR